MWLTTISTGGVGDPDVRRTRRAAYPGNAADREVAGRGDGRHRPKYQVGRHGRFQQRLSLNKFVSQPGVSKINAAVISSCPADRASIPSWCPAHIGGGSQSVEQGVNQLDLPTLARPSTTMRNGSLVPAVAAARAISADEAGVAFGDRFVVGQASSAHYTTQSRNSRPCAHIPATTNAGFPSTPGHTWPQMSPNLAQQGVHRIDSPISQPDRSSPTAERHR